MYKKYFLIMSLLVYIQIYAAMAESNPHIYIILGSTRENRSSNIFGKAIEKIAQENFPAIFFEVIDLKTWNLPFFHDALAPLTRSRMGQASSTDPKIIAWSDKIKQANGFIFVVPEYNLGLPGVFKNALDLLYTEWNHKPVILFCYSGSPSGGTNVAADLTKICKKLQMQIIPTQILIGNIGIRQDSINMLDKENKFKDQEIKHKINLAINEIIKEIK